MEEQNGTKKLKLKIRKDMSNEITTEDTIFILLNISLLGEDNVEVSDWSSVFSEMKNQAVAALPGEWLKTHPISQSWSSYCYLQQGQWVKIMHEQERLLSLLESHHIPSVIIKGAAAAMYYPHPSLRSMGDIDVFVKRQDFNAAAEILEKNGYVLSREKGHVSHHYNYSRYNICVELHKKIGVVRDSDEKLLTFFENGIDDREWCTAEGYRFPVLPPILNGLVLIFHINQHIRTGLGLRQIIDWMMFINELSEMKWYNELLPLLRETGMERLALTVTAMCQQYLGLRKIVEADDSLPCAELKDYIMAKGNFGRKAGDTDKTSAFVFFVRDKESFFRRLQAGGISRWSAARKYRVLRPFAWLYQLFRIIGIYAKEGMTREDWLEQKKNGMEQRRLFESLGLNLDIKIQ